MKAIILAGGRATRLPEAAKDVPKALVRVGGKPMLEHQIDQLFRHGFFDVRLALGYRAEQIIDYIAQSGLKGVEYVVEPEKLDTGGAIKFASYDLREAFLVLNGDILSDMDLRRFAQHFQKRPEENMIAVYRVPDARSYGIIKKEKGKVREFLEKPSDPVPGFINAGFYILSPGIFQNVQENRFLIETVTFPELAQSGNLSYYIHRGFWTDAGTEERLLEAHNFLAPYPTLKA